MFLMVAGTQTNLARFTFAELHMGGEVRITVYAPSPDRANRAVKAAYARIAELEQIMSDYRPTSEVRSLLSNQSKTVSKELFEVLTTAKQISQATNGAFDVTAGPAVALWRRSRQTYQLPGPIELQAAKSQIGFQFVDLDPTRRTVTITKKGVAIDLGGIAKGYAVDEAHRVLASYGLHISLIQAGGDLRLGQAPPNTDGWPIDLQGEIQHLHSCAISTSGDLEQFVEINGTRYSHIVNPNTGLGLTNQISATVIGSSGLITDPLATALCVMGQSGSKVAKNFGVRVLVISR